MTAPTRWGATPDDWSHLDLVLGLTADLLPVVSRPGAPISPDSTQHKGETLAQWRVVEVES